MIEDKLLNVLPFTVLMLPLGGFIVLALLGDWVKRDKEETGACVLACLSVLSSFAVSVFCVLRLYGLVAGPEGLQVGRAHLPSRHVGHVEPLGPAATRALLGPDADARAWLQVRPYLDTAVRVDVDDPDDPTPYWVVSTRDPEAVAAALRPARPDPDSPLTR